MLSTDKALATLEFGAPTSAPLLRQLSAFNPDFRYSRRSTLFRNPTNPSTKLSTCVFHTLRPISTVGYSCSLREHVPPALPTIATMIQDRLCRIWFLTLDRKTPRSLESPALIAQCWLTLLMLDCLRCLVKG